MGKHLSSKELDKMHYLLARGHRPKQIQCQVASSSAKIGRSAPDLTTVRRALRGATHKRTRGAESVRRCHRSLRCTQISSRECGWRIRSFLFGSAAPCLGIAVGGSCLSRVDVPREGCCFNIVVGVWIHTLAHVWLKTVLKAVLRPVFG